MAKRILIATGIFPPDIGGPAQYAKNLKDALDRAGHNAEVVTYRIERRLPSGLRHLYFFIKILPQMARSDFCIALDTFSVGLPAVAAGMILRKKVIIRTGGDFLWEQYVERTGKKVLLREFYKTEQANSSLKEKLIFRLTRCTLKYASVIVFSTEWQRDIWEKPYGIDLEKTKIIENYYGPKETSRALEEKEKVFIAGTRTLKWKNLDVLKNAFNTARGKNPELRLDVEQAPYEEFLEKIKRCYAAILVSLGDISPNMILDTIRLGKPFILTRETGIYDKLRDIGIFVDPLDERDIMEKIIWLADGKNYVMSQKKVESFNFNHSWEEIADEFLRI
jgi:glycosyltransferase involved in cell wall biosynthesis